MAKSPKQFRRPIEGAPLESLRESKGVKPSTVMPVRVQVGKAGFGARIKELISEPGINAFLRSTFPGAQVSSELRDPVREETRVFSAISLIADSAASVPLRVYTGDPDKEDRVELVPMSDPVVKLFDHVNPMMDPSELRERMAQGMEITGGVFWILTDASGGQVAASDKTDLNSKIVLPEEIWPVSQNVVRPILDKRSGLPIGWRVSISGGRTKIYDASSLLHFKYQNPSGGLMGMAPLEVAIHRARQIKRAMVYQDSILDNGGDPGGLLIAKDMGIEARDRLEQTVEEGWNDGAEAGDTRVLYGDIEYIPNPIGPKDMNYKDLTEVNWQAISEVFRTPATLFGVRAANFAEHELHMRMFWKLKMESVFRRWESSFNSRFFPRLRDPRQARYRAYYDTSSVEALADDLLDKAKLIKELLQVGIPLNACLLLAGVELDPVAGGDVSLVSTSLRLLSDLGKTNEKSTSSLDAANTGGSLPDSSTCAATGAQGSVCPSDASELSEREGDVGGSEVSLSDSGPSTLSAPPVESDLEESPKEDLEEEETSEEEETPEETQREAYLRRRSIEKATATRREPSERRIRKKVEAWSRRQKAAQLRHLDKIAKGPKKDSGVSARGARARGVMTRSAALGYLDAHAADAAEIARMETTSDDVTRCRAAWRKRYPRLARQFADDGLLLRAWMVKAELTQKELDQLVLAASQSKYWSDELAGELVGVFESAFDDSAKAIASELGADPFLSSESAAQKYIKAKAFKVSEGVTSTVAEDLKRKFAELFAESGVGGTGTLAEKLREVLPGAKDEVRLVFGKTHRRARTIARTETGMIDGNVRHQAMKKNGVEKHEWITSGLDNVRDDHNDLDGLIRELDETFPLTSGGTIRRAHDPDAGPEQLVNCACVMSPVIEE